MMMNRRLAAVIAPIVVLGLLSGCGGKRKPAVLTDPSGRPITAPSPLPEPSDTPVDPGPDVTALDPGTPRAEDYSAADASGEGGPLTDIHFAYDQSNLTDEARGVLEKHA